MIGNRFSCSVKDGLGTYLPRLLPGTAKTIPWRLVRHRQESIALQKTHVPLKESFVPIGYRHKPQNEKMEYGDSRGEKGFASEVFQIEFLPELRV
jgi:hypothetical protein